MTFFHQLFHDGDRFHIETSPLICSGFYLITASVMKELSEEVNRQFKVIMRKLIYVSQQTFILVKTCWRRLQDVLEDQKLLHFIMTKIDNRSVISLYFDLFSTFLFFLIYFVTPKTPYIFACRCWMLTPKKA